MQSHKISVVIPVYNEINTVQLLLEKVLEQQYSQEIIIVDDGSNDGTQEILSELSNRSHFRNGVQLKVLNHKKNAGKGAALRTGFKEVTGDIVIVQDADLEYDPAEYRKLLQPILDGHADVVYGSRFLGNGAHRIHLFWHYVGNKFLTTLSNMFTNLNLTDMETCYKVFRADILKELKLTSNRFGFEPEFTARISGNGFRIYEVPISYYGRGYSEGKKITWKDGLAAIYYIIKYNILKKIHVIS